MKFLSSFVKNVKKKSFVKNVKKKKKFGLNRKKFHKKTYKKVSSKIVSSKNVKNKKSFVGNLRNIWGKSESLQPKNKKFG